MLNCKTRVVFAAALVLGVGISAPATAQNRFRGMPPQSLVDAWERSTKAERPQITEALLENRAATVTTLRTEAVAGDTSRKMLACAMLGQLRDTGSVPTLLTATRDGDARVQERAVTALRVIGDPSAAPRFRQLIRTAPSRALLKRALAGLGKVGAAHDVALIRPLLSDPDETVQVMAAAALAMLGNAEGQDFLLAAIDGDNPLAQKNATLALGYLDTPEARSRLVEIIDDPYARWKSYALMAQALQDRRAQTPAQSVATLDRLARGRDRLAAMWALEELADLGTPEAAQALQAIAGHKGRRADVAQVRLEAMEGR